jgi:hypothetical protein
MKRMGGWAALAALCLLSAAACTDADIYENGGSGADQDDNKLTVKGSFCTEHPDELLFPVKIMFIIDCSQSTNVTDPPPTPNDYPGRLRAVWEVIQKFRYDSGVSYAIIRFDSAANVATQRDTNGDGVNDQFGFTNDLPSLLRALISLQAGGGNTSYQSAIALAEATLAMDMSITTVDERARTKYVVIFLSDGLPYPQDFDNDINTPGSIRRAVEELMALPARFDVADFTFHTSYLSVNTPDYVVAQAEALLKGLAKIGNGTFRNFQNGEQINFLDIDFTSVKRTFAVKDGAFLVSNLNAHPAWAESEAIDTDGDGLVDSLEFEIGTDPRIADTDGDGFSDLLEYRLRRSGFDPLDPDDADCRLALDRLDRDGDDLLDCEERFIGTNPELYDTDADGIPDIIEVRSGTNPVWPDALVDADFDGSLNGSEVAWHTNPQLNDAARFSVLGYRYNLSLRPGTFESRKCYDFGVANITLEGTLARKAGAPAGFNDIMVYVGQTPFDDPDEYGTFRVACARARYVPRYPDSDLKYPPSGVIKFQQRDFKRPTGTPCSLDSECPHQVCDPRNNLCLAPLGQACDAATPCPRFSCVEDPYTHKKTCQYPIGVPCLKTEDCPNYPADPVTGMCMDPARSAPDAVTHSCPRRECLPQYTPCGPSVPCPLDGDSNPDNDPQCLNGFCRVPCFSANDCHPGESCDPDRADEYSPACTLDADCPNPTGMMCLEGFCRTRCAQAADCPNLSDTCENVSGNSLCVAHHCVDHHGGTCAPLECASDADCPVQPCDDELHRCRIQPCLDSRECPYQVCEPVVGVCMGTSCATDDECRGERGYSCSDVVGDFCMFDLDCPFNRCSQQAKACYFGTRICDSTAQCGAGEVCLNRRCVKECQENTECPTNTCTGSQRCAYTGDPCSTTQDCGASGGQCVRSCSLNFTPCMQDGDCNPNFCRPYTVCATDPGQPCTESLDCPLTFCRESSPGATTGTCVNNPAISCNPQREAQDNVCQGGMLCQRQAGRGTCDTAGRESCETDADCPHYICNLGATNPACLYPVNISCSAPADCPDATWACEGGFCVKHCASDSDCPHASCQGRCVPRDPDSRRRCTDWFDPDRDCKVFGDTSASGP